MKDKLEEKAEELKDEIRSLLNKFTSETGHTISVRTETISTFTEAGIFRTHDINIIINL